MNGTHALVLALSVVSIASAAAAAGGPSKKHPVAPSKSGNLVVALCDGKTQVEVPGKKPGDTLSRAEAQAVSDRLMREWKAKNPHALWDAAPVPSAQLGGAPATGEQVQGQVYGGFTARDLKIWAASTQAFVDTGKKIFHDAGQLGGTIGVSCDMCHPDAANTHPETYPKYQVQLGRVALLRDMINWCIENPVRGKLLADDDPRMKALEAFILAKRKGVALENGKH